MKIQIQSITVDPIETGAPEFTFDSFKEVNAALGQLSQFAPKGGAYNKCDFTIVFEDGNEYNGRYDLKHWTEELPSLEKHVQDFLRFSAGLDVPAHSTLEKWEEFLADCEYYNPGARESAKNFFFSYDVGVDI